MRRTLTVIQDYYAAHNVAPSIQEIMDAEGGRSKAPVHRRVQILLERGHLVRLPGRDRAYVPAQTADLSCVPEADLHAELEKRRTLHG